MIMIKADDNDDRMMNVTTTVVGEMMITTDHQDQITEMNDGDIRLLQKTVPMAATIDIIIQTNEVNTHVTVERVKIIINNRSIMLQNMNMMNGVVVFDVLI